MCGCGVVRTCVAVAQRLLYPKEGLAPPEAEKLTAPVSLTRPSTVTPGATAAATWATTSAAPAGTLALGCGAGSTGVPTTRGDGTSLAGASSVVIGGPMTCVGWDEGVAALHNLRSGGAVSLRVCSVLAARALCDSFV